MNDINVYFINSDFLASHLSNLGVFVNCRKLLKTCKEIIQKQMLSNN